MAASPLTDDKPKHTPGAGKPKVYVFANGAGPMGVFGAAIAEDGTVLPAGHCSSSMAWCRRDMGADGACTWKHDVYGAHYPDGFEIEWVENVRHHEVLSSIIDKLNAEAPADDEEA